ncbi:MAG: tetratricopeptide repeat protein [Candidatus Omnitrophica bacterium]|nr:tetratricopeptide repeat protein [Candidatus Omnitrophota bacterium]
MTRSPLIPSAVRAAGFFLLSLLLTGAGVEVKPGDILLQDAVSYRAEGRQLQDAGELQRASAAYRRAVAVNPRYAEAFNDLGVVLESMGDLAGAEKAYKEALVLKPDFAAAHSNLALLYEETNRPKEAGEHWTARIRLGPPDDPWVMRARERMERHKIPVLDTPRQSAEKKSQAVKLAILAGQTHMDARRWDDAIREFERALDMEPGNAKANRYLNVARLKAAEAERRMGREMERSTHRVLRDREEAAREKEEAALRKVEERKRRVEAVRAAEPSGPRRPWWKFWAGDPQRQRRREMEKAAEQARRLREAQEEALREAEQMLSKPAAPKPAPVAPAPQKQPPAVAPAMRPASEPPKPAAPAPLTAAKPAPASAPAPAPAPAPVKVVSPAPAVRPAPARPEPALSKVEGPSLAEAQRLALEYARQRAETTRDSRDELYQRGITAMREGDYSQAAEHFRQVLALDPRDVEAQQALARAERAWEKEQRDQAQGDF